MSHVPRLTVSCSGQVRTWAELEELPRAALATAAACSDLPMAGWGQEWAGSVRAGTGTHQAPLPWAGSLCGKLQNFPLWFRCS